MPPLVISVQVEMLPLAVMEMEPPAMVVATRMQISLAATPDGSEGVTAPVPEALALAALKAMAMA